MGSSRLRTALLALTALLFAADAFAQSASSIRRRRPGHEAPPSVVVPVPSSAPAAATPEETRAPAPTEAKQAPPTFEPAPIDYPAPKSAGTRAPALVAVPPSAPEPRIGRRAGSLGSLASAGVRDRWRIVELVGVNERWWDPYNQNTLKSDRPAFGEDWFINIGVISDSLFEGRSIPVPRGDQATEDAGNLDVFGDGNFQIYNQNWLFEVALTKGNTTFKPPDWEIRMVGVGNLQYVEAGERGILHVNPDRGTTRDSGHFAFQELFVDRHLRNVSDDYDFDSLRVGIQNFITDFRGFLFLEEAPGVRLFGNRFRNRLQYNAAWFRRLEKDTNTGLNSVFEDRADDVFVANVYYQDFPVKGLVTSGLLTYNRNREGDRAPHFNDNGFIERPASIGDERPHNYDVVYLGSGVDGSIGRINVTANGFLALGEDDYNSIAGQSTDIFAYLLALEASIDIDWMRLKAYGYHSSGDSDPHDNKARGFDAINENPNFAGAITGYWHRQTMPLIAGGEVFLSARDALLPSLRSSKEHGQSNFVNPGLWMWGLGADFDVLPELRIITNATSLEFDDTAVLRTTRNQRAVGSHIGFDLSTGVIYRPWFINNVVFNVSGAILVPGDGLKDLYEDRYDIFYSTIFNMILTY